MPFCDAKVVHVSPLEALEYWLQSDAMPTCVGAGAAVGFAPRTWLVTRYDTVVPVTAVGSAPPGPPRSWPPASDVPLVTGGGTYEPPDALKNRD
jgi:hypothetical protein